MLKIRRPLGRLIFNMGIAIPGKTVFLIETAPSALGMELRLFYTNPSILRSRQNGWHFADDICQFICVCKNCYILIRIYLNMFPMAQLRINQCCAGFDNCCLKREHFLVGWDEFLKQSLFNFEQLSLLKVWSTVCSVCECRQIRNIPLLAHWSCVFLALTHRYMVSDVTDFYRDCPVVSGKSYLMSTFLNEMGRIEKYQYCNCIMIMRFHLF